MSSSQRRRQRQSQENQYADAITVGSQSVISGLTTDDSASISTFSTLSTAHEQRQSQLRARREDAMSTINDDYDDDSKSKYSSSNNTSYYEDEDDLTIISRYSRHATNVTQNVGRNILTATLILIGGVLIFNSSVQLHHEDYQKSIDHAGRSALSLLQQKEELISRNAHDVVVRPPAMIRGNLPKQLSEEDVVEDRSNGAGEVDNTARNLQWLYEPETVELREPHPLIHRPNVDDLKMLVQTDSKQVYNKPHNEPLSVCGRPAAISPEKDRELMTKFQSNCQPVGPDDPILLIEGVETFGRTGNNLIEFLHALEKAQNEGLTVGIMMDSWLMPVITTMWMAIQNDDMMQWKEHMELTFCVKMLSHEDLSNYTNIIQMETRDLFMYKTRQSLPDYIEFQTYHIRNLFRNYNSGVGHDIRHRKVSDMCTGINALFGPNKQSSQIYSVIHSRNLEGYAGHELLGRVAKNSGCDPEAALNLEPEYIKAILEPIGLLDHPIVFLTDHQRPEILERLMADKDIGPKILLVPDEASWVGGDITLGIMANAFIGNPASTFSGFIAKSRMALGFGENHLFRAKNEKGEWEEVCSDKCVFWKRMLWNMA